MNPAKLPKLLANETDAMAPRLDEGHLSLCLRGRISLLESAVENGISQ